MTDRHAYLILAHTNLNQLRMLLSSLDDARNDIYVHLDADAPFGYGELEGVCAHSRLFFIAERISVHWGGVSIVRAEMALMQAAVLQQHSYYHLLSGMDFPIKSQNEIHAFFEANAGCEFLNLWKCNGHTLRRVKYFTPFPEGSRCWYTNLFNHFVKSLLAMFGIQQNRGVEFCKGSQWFSITHELAQYIVSRSEWVEKTFRHTTLCDEYLVPTIVHGTPFQDRLYRKNMVDDTQVNDGNMRFIDWKRSPSIRHPYVLRGEDFEMLKSVPHLWARKFDEKVDPGILASLLDYTKGK